MLPLPRLVLSALLALVLLASPAAASEATDAYKHARALAKEVQRADGDEARAAKEKELRDYVTSKAESLLSGELSKLDTAYVGRLYGEAGMHAEAVATLEKALKHPGRTKYASTIYLLYARALVNNQQWDQAYATYRYMKDKYEGDKNLKMASMSVGLGLRSAKRWKESAEALDTALRMKNALALKPLVNSLLLDGRRDEAVAAIEFAIEAAGARGADEGHPILLEITKLHGETLPLDFDAFAPADAPPDLAGKVVVMGVWNVSAGSLRWTMEHLQAIWDKFPPKEGVETLAVTTYYKKNPETGLFEEDMAPEAEREIGLSYREHHAFKGLLAYTKDRAGLQALGCSALPYIVIVGKDGKLLYAHTINRKDPTEIEVIHEIIERAKR